MSTGPEDLTNIPRALLATRLLSPGSSRAVLLLAWPRDHSKQNHMYQYHGRRVARILPSTIRHQVAFQQGPGDVEQRLGSIDSLPQKPPGLYLPHMAESFLDREITKSWVAPRGNPHNGTGCTSMHSIPEATGGPEWPRWKSLTMGSYSGYHLESHLGRGGGSCQQH